MLLSSPPDMPAPSTFFPFPIVQRTPAVQGENDQGEGSPEDNYAFPYYNCGAELRPRSRASAGVFLSRLLRIRSPRRPHRAHAPRVCVAGVAVEHRAACALHYELERRAVPRDAVQRDPGLS